MEIRDPLHVFVRLDSAERAVLDSMPFQRLRSIHQLALTHLVYPGATHRRFEHSLGVMELAARIFDVVTDTKNLHHDEAREVIPDETERLLYWRKVVKLAALCHDLGHLPFSHAAEDELLPDGVDHEEISRAYIYSEEMASIWSSLVPMVNPDHIALLAVGPRSKSEVVPPWQAILSEIITGDVFGADRMDYLLRDSLHTGVAYGRFDHHRLISTLRILPDPPGGPAGEDEQSRAPGLGIEAGGVESAEALLLARYFSFSQVYFHKTRRIYDIHLKDFLKEWVKPRGGFLPSTPKEHLALTDNEVLVAIQEHARDESEPLRTLARRIVERDQRFCLVFEPTPTELECNADAGVQIAAALSERYGADAVRHDRYGKASAPFDFAVMRKDREVVSSTGASEVLARVPNPRFDYVFLDPRHRKDAESWLKQNRSRTIEPAAVEEDDLPEG